MLDRGAGRRSPEEMSQSPSLPSGPMGARMIRSVRVARMAQVAKMPTTVHISGGFGFVYMLHFASCVPDVGRYQEYKLGTEKYGSWFDSPIRVKDGKMSIPGGPGVGIKDVTGLLKEAKEA